MEGLIDWLAPKTSTVLVAAGTVFMFVPVIVVVLLSFSDHTYIQFPPRLWGLHQYRTLLGSPYWLNSIATSFEVAIPAAAAAIAVGVPAVFALNRTTIRFRRVLRLIGLAPLVIPGVAFAVAVYTLYVQLRLSGTYQGVVLAHVILGLPFVLLIVGAGIGRIPVRLELVAMTLGANRLRATFGITLRLLAPFILAAYIFAFLASFDEAVFVNFVAGPFVNTLPRAIFNSLETGLDPVITSIATILMLVTACMVIVATVSVERRPS